MILRRFMQHVKEQNWIAVGLDVVVVIVGIFLGLQVQAWYDGRETEQQEEAVLETLQSEVNNRLQIKIIERQRIEEQYDAIISSLTIMFDKEDVFALSEFECTSVWRSHIYEWSYLPLVSLEELVASGRLGLISKEALRLKIMEYSNKIQEWEINSQNVRLVANVLVDDYPTLLLRKWQDNQNTVKCELDQMRTNQLFLNQLQSNLGRLEGFVINTGKEIVLLRQLIQLLTIKQTEEVQ